MNDKERLDFISTDTQNRMLTAAELFKTRNNPYLYKKYYPTGFTKLDETLGGGLTAGLHCLGAVSSLGKSTFIMQIADNMAAYGMPSIVFSLEMKTLDLTAKAISRQTYIDTPSFPHLAKSADILRNESAAAKFSNEEWMVIQIAAEKVCSRGQYISIVECGAEPYTVDKVGKYVQDYIQTYQIKPVVVLDYLQILDPPNNLRSASDKQVADYNLKRLKVLSDYFDLPVLLISSFNRENYDAEVSFKSFKDSGNIEYSCDIVLGLQLQGVGKEGFNAEKAKAKYPREVELKILKQRHGKIGRKIPFRFFTKYNYFEETDMLTDIEEPQVRRMY